MQTPKSRNSSSSAQQKNSPQGAASSSEGSQKVSPRVTRQLKTGPRYFEHTASSLNLAAKPPKEQSPKASEHRSPRSSSASEKKHRSRVTELESQVSQLENDLSTVKDQLLATEASKKIAEEEAEVANKQISALSSKIDELQGKISDNLSSNDAVLGQEQSKAVKLEPEAVQENSALEERKQSYEKSQAELTQAKQSLSETQLLVEEMKNQLKQSEESEARAQEMVRETLMQLENAKKMMDVLGLDVAADLKKSRARVDSLEELVGELKSQIRNNRIEAASKSEIESAETEIGSGEFEAQRLGSAREAAEILETKETTEAADEEETNLEAELRAQKDTIEELKAKLLDKETELQCISEENEGLTKKLDNTLSSHGEEELNNLKALLAEKEHEFQNIAKENETLKSLIEETRSTDPEKGEIESVRASEREALMKVGYLTEEIDRSNRKVARITEQLDSVQSTNSEMEAEMRRIRVQSDQWRKAAEAAAAMMSAGGGGNNGQRQLVERTGSMDSHYSSPRMKNMGSGSPYGDEIDEDLMKKKNGANVLRRFWKKSQR